MEADERSSFGAGAVLRASAVYPGQPCWRREARLRDDGVHRGDVRGEARTGDVVWGPVASGEAGSRGASGLGREAQALPHHGGRGFRVGGEAQEDRGSRPGGAGKVGDCVSWLLKRMVRLYPQAWRERYQEEFGALLEERTASVADVYDVALGALDAWLFPQVVQERSVALMVSRMRRSVLLVLWAWVGVVAAGVGFQKMTEYEDFVRAARESPPVGMSFDAAVVGALVALAAVFAGSVPIVLAALGDAFRRGRKDVPLLLCVPPLALGVFVGYVLLLMKVVYPPWGTWRS